MSRHTDLAATIEGSELNERNPKSRLRKRLIVLCDGTWQDSTSDLEEYPTNVTRISRAIAPFATVDHPDGSQEEVEQIIYYEKGVGTDSLSKLLGGAIGVGLSACVRSAYGFLAHNYEPGDEIFFFGYSRGAYTARAIAGLVTKHGLLTKMGMDSFADVYKLYYTDGSKNPQEEKVMDDLAAQHLLDRGAANAVKVIGVWETVGYHKPWIASLLGIEGEYFEFHNEELSDRVTYGFHALALDERRKTFKPTLWKMPVRTISGARGSQNEGLREMTQVWFTGEHGDVGGGRDDHHLSDITLAWMIAQCSKHNQLQFQDEYLLGKSPPPQLEKFIPWDTCKGKSKQKLSFGYWLWSIIPFLNYNRQPLQEQNTNEVIHCSIADRKFRANAGAKSALSYPCRVLTGRKSSDGWQLAWSKEKALVQVDADAVEMHLKGRIRSAKNNL